MGVQPNAMWQQPAPQSSSTNPFAAPAGGTVSDEGRFSLYQSTACFYRCESAVSSSLLPTRSVRVFLAISPLQYLEGTQAFSPFLSPSPVSMLARRVRNHLFLSRRRSAADVPR